MKSLYKNILNRVDYQNNEKNYPPFDGQSPYGQGTQPVQNFDQGGYPMQQIPRIPPSYDALNYQPNPVIYHQQPVTVITQQPSIF